MEEVQAGGAWLLLIRLVCADEEEGRKTIGDSLFLIYKYSYLEVY
jgi:hypothetical protein